jgi:hypothetical protein
MQNWQIVGGSSGHKQMIEPSQEQFGKSIKMREHL